MNKITAEEIAMLERVAAAQPERFHIPADLKERKVLRRLYRTYGMVQPDRHTGCEFELTEDGAAYLNLQAFGRQLAAMEAEKDGADG